MAELLIFAQDNVHSDPVKSERGCHKRGDIISVRPDGFEWGRKELIPPVQGGKFCHIRITDVTVEQVHNKVRAKFPKFTQGICEPDFSDTEVESDGKPLMLHRKRISLNPDWIPTAVRRQLWNTGFYETSWQQIRNYVRDKRDNAPID